MFVLFVISFAAILESCFFDKDVSGKWLSKSGKHGKVNCLLELNVGSKKVKVVLKINKNN